MACGSGIPYGRETSRGAPSGGPSTMHPNRNRPTDELLPQAGTDLSALASDFTGPATGTQRSLRLPFTADGVPDRGIRPVLLDGLLYGRLEDFVVKLLAHSPHYFVVEKLIGLGLAAQLMPFRAFL